MEFFFFFQAEDGIRDATVTGVQTCALPIWDALPALQHPRPVDAEAVGVELEQGEEEPAEVALVAAERADDRGRERGGFDRLLQSQVEHRVRAHLDEEAMAVREQGARGLLEPDRLAEVAVPVGRVELA